MRVPLLALLGRSLRHDSRAVHLYLMRLGLLVFLLLSLFVAHMMSLREGAPGLRFFSMVVVINLVFICVAGVGYFSSVITEEKEEMTLGLLRLTGLSPLAILLGKGAARLIGALMLLVAQFPFTLLAVTLGGVSLRQVFAAYATLMSFMAAVAGLALLASVISRSTVRAAAVTLLVLLGLLIVPPVGVSVLGSSPSTEGAPATAVVLRLAEWLVAANPFVRAGEILRTGFAGHPFGAQALSNLGAAAACLLLSCALFGRATREQQAAAPARGLVRPRTSRLGWFRVDRPWADPIAWKEFHFVTGGRAMLLGRLVVLGGLTALVVGLFAAAGNPMPAIAVGATMVIVPVVLASLESVAHGSRTLREEISWGTLASLMLLPVSPSRVIRSKVVGFLPVLLPYGAWFVLGLLVAAASDPDAFVEGAVFQISSGLPWYLVANVVAFVHFVLLISLFVRRGAVPVAFALWVVAGWRIQGSFVGLLTLGTLGSAVYCTVMAVLLGVLTVLIHWGSCARLDSIAGD